VPPYLKKTESFEKKAPSFLTGKSCLKPKEYFSKGFPEGLDEEQRGQKSRYSREEALHTQKHALQ
jgi:hypothetical protein